MAQVFTGRDGRLLVDDTEQAKVTNWSLTGSLEVLETTTLGDSERSYTPGVQEFSGTATLLYYVDDEGTNDASTLLKKVLKTGAVASTDTVTLKLRLVQGNANKDVELTAYITSVTYGASVGEVSTAQISFQATGALDAVTI
jgi:hypothetical protein